MKTVSIYSPWGVLIETDDLAGWELRRKPKLRTHRALAPGQTTLSFSPVAAPVSVSVSGPVAGSVSVSVSAPAGLAPSGSPHLPHQPLHSPAPTPTPTRLTSSISISGSVGGSVSVAVSAPVAPVDSAVGRPPLTNAEKLARAIEMTKACWEDIDALGIDVKRLPGKHMQEKAASFLATQALAQRLAVLVPSSLPPSPTSLPALIRRLPVPPLIIAPIVLTARATATERELLSLVTPQVARTSLLHLAEGYQRSGPTVAPAETNSRGCWLATVRRHEHGGHCSMGPHLPFGKGVQQNIHRLCIRGWGSEQDQRRMFDGWDVSHLCHEPTCFNPHHLVVETKAANQRRRPCNADRVCVCGGTPQCLLA